MVQLIEIRSEGYNKGCNEEWESYIFLDNGDYMIDFSVLGSATQKRVFLHNKLNVKSLRKVQPRTSPNSGFICCDSISCDPISRAINHRTCIARSSYSE